MSDEPTSIRWAATGADLPDLRATQRRALEAGGAHVRVLAGLAEAGHLKTRPGPANGALQSLQRGDLGMNRTMRRMRYSRELDISSDRETGCFCAIPHMPMAW
jgi:hypothetical protein